MGFDSDWILRKLFFGQIVEGYASRDVVSIQGQISATGRVARAV